MSKSGYCSGVVEREKMLICSECKKENPWVVWNSESFSHEFGVEKSGWAGTKCCGAEEIEVTCPDCGSVDITGTIVGDIFGQELPEFECNDCGLKWL